MKRTLFCLVALLAPAGVGASGPLEVTYYDVHGDTLQDIGSWMNQHGPAGADGRRFHGYTEWTVGWRFRLKPGRAGCAVESLETGFRATMQLPEWRRPDDASPMAVREWERYSAALRAHEDGHFQTGAAAREAIERELAAMRSTSGCPALAKELDARGMAIIGEHQAREREYDASTRHGATQGARLQVDGPR